jgi:hypothetical protein
MPFPLISAALAQQKFDTQIKQVPFARIAEMHEIDNRCPRTGKNDSNTYHYSQNAAENNLTVKGTPVAITFKGITRLQQAADDQIKQGHIKPKGTHAPVRVRIVADTQLMK